MKDFFEDLENRGSEHPRSTFQIFTKSVREKMTADGTWIEDDEDNLDFVAEYVSRLLREYRERSGGLSTMWNVCNGRFAGYEKEFLEFRKIYLKIRVWGLRTKRFRLRKWPLVRYPLNFDQYPQIWTVGFKNEIDHGRPAYRYILLVWTKDPSIGGFYVKEKFLKLNNDGLKEWKRV
jgi:hypothetical protein